MKNGSRFSRLILVDSASSYSIHGKKGGLGSEDDPAAYFPSLPDGEAAPAQGSEESKLFLIFLTLSITCAAATVATGGYAVWLARQQIARRTLTDVNEILRSCQSRMSQLESDLQRLPNRQG